MKKNKLLPLRRKKKVMLIDDDSSILTVLSIILEDMNYETVAVTDSRTAVRVLNQVKPELVVLDLVMPYVDGAQILEEMKKDKLLAKIPVIIVSASNSIEDVAAKYNTRGYFKKPFDVNRFYSSVESILGAN